MSDLAALQAGMAEALVSGRYQAVSAWIKAGPIAPHEALAVHRNTALLGLVNALRLTHPTVAALVGEAFFDRMALDFAIGHPPAGAWLAGYGEGFAEFLEAYAPARALPYLADVARLDFAIERVGSGALGQDGRVLDLGEALLTLDASLHLLALNHPAPAIRDAIGDDERLAGLDATPSPQRLALWRLPDGAGLRALSPVSAAVLHAMLAGEDPGHLLAGEADLAALQTEVFAAPFARISLKPS
jgi:hypothetical protein